MKHIPHPRGGLSVAALLVALVVPLAVGWWVERVAYGNAKAAESVVAPLRDALPAKPPAHPVRVHTLFDDPQDDAQAAPAAPR